MTPEKMESDGRWAGGAVWWVGTCYIRHLTSSHIETKSTSTTLVVVSTQLATLGVAKPPVTHAWAVANQNNIKTLAKAMIYIELFSCLYVFGILAGSQT